MRLCSCACCECSCLNQQAPAAAHCSGRHTFQLIKDGARNTKVSDISKILTIHEATTKTLIDKLMQLIQVIILPAPKPIASQISTLFEPGRSL